MNFLASFYTITISVSRKYWPFFVFWLFDGADLYTQFLKPRIPERIAQVFDSLSPATPWILGIALVWAIVSVFHDLRMEKEKLRSELEGKQGASDENESSLRRIYSIAIEVLTELSEEMFQDTTGLLGYLWSTEFPDWGRIAGQLVDRSFTTGKTKAFVEPSVFSGDDQGKMKAAVKVVKMYVWASRNNQHFGTIQDKYELPTSEEACEALRKAGYSCD